MELIKFIKKNPDWETKLTADPYNLKIRKKDQFVLFYYNQLSSDFTNEIVKECRGVILDSTDWTVARYAFKKFFNADEPNCDVKIDWASAVVSEKIDGSLVSAWWDKYQNKWRWATSKTIDAEDAPLLEDVNCPFKNYQELINYAMRQQGYKEQNFCRSFTYNFELVSPYTRVVIEYPKPQLYFLCSVENADLTELPSWDYPFDVLKPKVKKLSSYEECAQAAKELPWDEEGYVVRDKFGHRVKIKSPEYVKAHYLRNNNVITKKKLIQIILDNEVDEFLTYCPDYEEALDKLIWAMSNVGFQCKAGLSSISILSKNEWRNWTGEQIQILMNQIPLLRSAYVQNYIWLNWKNPNLLPAEYLKKFTAGQWEKILIK